MAQLSLLNMQDLNQQDAFSLLLNKIVANQADQQFQKATADLIAKYSPQIPLQSAQNPAPMDVKAAQKQIQDAQAKKAIENAKKAAEKQKSANVATAARLKAESLVGDPQLNLDASRFSGWLLS